MPIHEVSRPANSARPVKLVSSSSRVLLGTLGGIGLLVGPAGLLWLNLRRSPLHGDARQ
jgi:hypothetical protein